MNFTKPCVTVVNNINRQTQRILFKSALKGKDEW